LKQVAVAMMQHISKVLLNSFIEHLIFFFKYVLQACLCYDKSDLGLYTRWILNDSELRICTVWKK
jgi:hypothetical protein